MKVLFLDTNIFLQCRDINELPWEEITQAEHLLLLIPTTVQGEIDNLKSDGNSRRAKRARKATSFIRQIILNEGSRLVIRASNPRAEISFPPAVRSQELQFEGLDLSRSDDLIIAEALVYKSQHPNEEVALITHDTIPMLTAKRCNLPYVVIPDEWLLPPEPDAKDKRIAVLEQQVKELKMAYPDIRVEAYDANGESVEALSVRVLHCRQLEDSEIKELIDIAKSKYPMNTDFTLPPDRQAQDFSLASSISPVLHNIFTMHRYPPTEEEIKKYREKDYPAWLEELRAAFRSLSTQLEFPGRHVDLSISLANQGTVPAENLIVEFKTLPGLLLSPPKEEKETGKPTDPKLPKPPRAPGWRIIDPLSSINETAKYLEMWTTPKHIFPSVDSSLLASSRPRGRHAFYWKPKRPHTYSSSWTLECEEFRHQVEAEDFAITISIPPTVDFEKGTLQCRVTARNIPKPVEFTLRVHIVHEHRDTMMEANQLLQDLLP